MALLEVALVSIRCTFCCGYGATATIGRVCDRTCPKQRGWAARRALARSGLLPASADCVRRDDSIEHCAFCLHCAYTKAGKCLIYL